MTVLSGLYARVTSLRRAWYARHPERQRRLERPVISVGNLVVGGSGKTPVVAAIARLLIEMGERPSILSRGYGRKETVDGVLVVSDGERVLAPVEQSGDEPFMLARSLTGVPVFVSPDRYLAGTLAERKFGCTVHILDDGFQHLRLARDVDVVVMARADLDDRVLPSGRLREPIDALRTADAVLVTGPEEDVQAVGRVIFEHVGRIDLDPRAQNPRIANVLRIVPEYGEPRPFRLKPEATTEANAAIGEDVASGFSRKGARVVAVAGIARPQRFFDALRANGFEVVREFTFRDHHWFTSGDINRIEQTATDAGAEIITTEKDFARVGRWSYLPMTVSIQPQDSFAVWLHRRLGKAHAA